MRSKIVFLTVVLVLYTLQDHQCTASTSAAKKLNRYIGHFFQKYGSGGSMSFEGLEHLMHSLGLGGVEFDPSHNIDEHRPKGYTSPKPDPAAPEVEIPEQVNSVRPLAPITKQSMDQPLASLVSNSVANESAQDDDTSEEEDEETEAPDLPVTERNLVRKTVLAHAADLYVLRGASYSSSSTLEPRAREETPADVTKPQEVDQVNEVNFKEMHDPKQRYPRHHDRTPSSNRCLSPISLMKLVVGTNDAQQRRFARNVAEDGIVSEGKENEEYYKFISSVKITPDIFMQMCPALLLQIDQEACAVPLIDEYIKNENMMYAWIYASVAILIISCCGLFGVAIVPLTKSMAYNEILKFLVAVAVGTLCGDALMHLLPHALQPHHEGGHQAEDEDPHQAVWLCGCAFLTALFMYSIETLLPLVKGSSGHNHSHGHHHSPKQVEPSTSIEVQIMPKNGNGAPKEISVMLDEDKVDTKGSSKLSPVALMVVLGDGLHNLTDGLAIGAAFASDPVTGMATAFAVLCHELPHELGDFALLLKTGVNMRRAMSLNIVSSVLSFLGMAVGLLVAGMHENMVRWIYSGTAGSFLYIALTDLIPEMGRDGPHNLKNCLIQIFGILLGGIIMLLIAVNEDDLRIIFE